MNRTMRCMLTASIAIALGAPADASAVALSPNGTGQVLLYPYYTVEGANQTLVSVVNADHRAKAVRVRFNEARNGRDVLQINLYLAPGDTWTAALFASFDSGPAQFVTFDSSCTVPTLAPGMVVPFRNYQYSGALQDHPSSLITQLSALERTREGYIEMIDMGTLREGFGPTELGDEAISAARGAAGCSALLNAWLPPAGGWYLDGGADIGLPSGGLYGAVSIVDVGEGTMLGYRAEALVDFFTNTASPGALHQNPGAVRPTLASADNGGGVARARVIADGIGPVTESYPSGSPLPDAVSLVLMQGTLLNEFNSDPAIGSATEWVVTFPTKGLYVDQAGSSLVQPPFTNAFRDDGRSREIVTRDFRDRDARPRGFADNVCESVNPFPTPGPSPEFCERVLTGAFDNVTNVVAFGSVEPLERTPVLGARFDRTARLFATQRVNGVVAPSGWASVRFEDDRRPGRENGMIGPTSGITYPGLPAIGFAAIRFLNENVQPGVLATFGDTQRHRGTLEAFLIEAGATGATTD